MKFDGEIEISGIERIVINHLIVWERTQLSSDYVKILGGTGFKQKVLPPEMMKREIDRYLEKEGVIGKWQGLDVTGKLYRAWFKEGTLNIIQKEHWIS
jgi:hypothetical protein